MANASKRKGDRAELEAVSVLHGLAPDLCVSKPQRMLGAGRAEDVGDLHVFADVAIQVRAYAKGRLGVALRSAARDSVTQAANGDKPFALGLVPYPGANRQSVRWLACVEPGEWPAADLHVEAERFTQVGRAFAWLRDDTGPSREDRLAHLANNATTHVLVAPVEAWVDAYRGVTVGERAA